LSLLASCALPHGRWPFADGAPLDDAPVIDAVPDVIDAGVIDAAIADADATIDIAADADATLEARPDALPDALPDARPDARPDALPDALPDARPDALPDARPDVNGSRDSGVTIALAMPMAGTWLEGSTAGMQSTPIGARCPNGSLVVGVRAIIGYNDRGEGVLEGYTLLCKVLLADGTLGADRTSPTVGSTTDPATTTVRESTCEPGAVTTINSVWAGEVVDTARLDCVSLADELQRGARTVLRILDFTALMGGARQAASCPAHAVLTGLDAREVNYYGVSRIAALRPICAAITISAP
jgi:hypothetical protein